MVPAQSSKEWAVQSRGFLIPIRNQFRRSSQGKEVFHRRYNAGGHGAQTQPHCAQPGASWQPVAGRGRGILRSLRVSFSQSFCLEIRPNIKHIGRGTI